MAQLDVPSRPYLLLGRHVVVGVTDHSLEGTQGWSCFAGMKQSEPGKEAFIIFHCDLGFVVDSPYGLVSLNCKLFCLSSLFSVEVGLGTE